MTTAYVSRWEVATTTGPVVVVDVLRAFTTAAYAFAAGVEVIYLVAEVDEALAFKADNPGSLAIGESGGLRPDGFDFPNSPARIAEADVVGRTLVQRTSAGTQGVVAAASADRLWVASLVCASATANAVLDAAMGDPTYVITGLAADGRASSGEDDLLTAELIERARRREPLRTEATSAALQKTGQAKRTLALGVSHADPLDVELASRVDMFDFAMEVVRDERGLRLEQRWA